MTIGSLESSPGLLRCASGGTRNQVKLDRPWQVDLSVDPANCPFEADQQREVARFDCFGGWRILENPHTPFRFHRLIVPLSCWPKERLRSLGGREGISAALELADSIIGAHDGELWLGIHIGALAGQNVAHLHYHVLEPLERSEMASSEAESAVFQYCRESQLVVLERPPFRLVAGGCRAGQCFVVGSLPRFRLSAAITSVLADVLASTVALYNRKFRSIQGLPPDYMIGIRFHDGRMLYGYYVPILSQWGFTEHFGLVEGTPLILPWPHEETVRHLAS